MMKYGISSDGAAANAVVDVEKAKIKADAKETNFLLQSYSFSNPDF